MMQNARYTLRSPASPHMVGRVVEFIRCVEDRALVLLVGSGVPMWVEVPALKPIGADVGGVR